MKKILIVAPFCSLPMEPHFNRFLYLADILSSEFDVTLVTSNFRHYDKRHRKMVGETLRNFKIVLINEPGYKKNVSFGRVLSHAIFCNNFKRWLIENNEFDVVYSAYPLIRTNIILGKFKCKFKYNLIIDVQDVWPESIQSVFPLLRYFPDRLNPFSILANRAYSYADAIVGVSSTYVTRALQHSCAKLSQVVYIGSNFELIESAESLTKKNDVFILTYIGSLSFSYDVKTIIEAVDILKSQAIPIEFHVFGGGPQLEYLQSLESPNTFFHGFVDVQEVYAFLKITDVAVNAIVPTAKQSITNKLSDYLSVGLPILNSQKCPEVLSLLDDHEHENYDGLNVNSAVNAIKIMYMKSAGYSLKPRHIFNRTLEYQKIGALINEVERG